MPTAANQPPRLYHNPRCSKSRAALELLRAQGVEPELVLYLEHPPGVEQLRTLAGKLGGDVRAMVREVEPEFADLRLDDPSLDDDRLIAALAGHPRLLQRPILETADRARIGRPPEALLEIL